jgi:hypothetical protein
MDTRDVIRIFFAILQLCFYGIGFIGYRRLRKAIKGLEKQKGEEIVSEDLQKVILTGGKLILIGIISGSIFGIIAILFLHDII